MSKKQTYAQVSNSSAHGSSFSIEDIEEELVLVETISNDDPVDQLESHKNYGVCSLLNSLTFSWMRPLLNTGNLKALELTDLYPLSNRDKSNVVYNTFKKHWDEQLHQSSNEYSKKPSLSKALFLSYGIPFCAAGFLKLIHDSCLFIGPLLLNKIINYLNNPSESKSIGLLYVLGLFVANFTMSLCLRQYFWWCYRVGMNLRSAVITSVFSKSLVMCSTAMSRRTTGEISNLMSVDSSRFQDLTPYLHAIWYSFFQIALALYFLWQQLGVSCLAGISVIIITIPITSQISKYMKKLQKSLSSIRDERIKLCNEVLSGMKVIKLQSWEKEFCSRLEDVRQKELKVFRAYSISQSLSGSLFTTLPLLVAISTFIVYIALGHSLDVATALTSLALFDILRFPLFMLPNVINNIVEARVSVQRVEDFLMESESVRIGSFPLRQNGSVLMKNTTSVWEGSIKFSSPKQPTTYEIISQKMNRMKENITKLIFSSSNNQMRESSNNTYNPIAPSESKTNGVELTSFANSKTNNSVNQTTNVSSSVKSNANKTFSNRDEFIIAVKNEQLCEYERYISELEKKVTQNSNQFNQNSIILSETNSSPELSHQQFAEDPFMLERNNYLQIAETNQEDSINVSSSDRLISLSRISLYASPFSLTSIVGTVGSGKSSLLSTLLGNTRLFSGVVATRGSIAYTNQVSFIQNSSVRDNILFGQHYDEERYQRTLFECSLLSDLEVLPAGDATEIGERGINLSGGQKARVALARAVYSNADIYLLDDPLSAVDAHVAQHIFENCILNLKERGKCVVLVTNALQFLQSSTQIIVMNNGRISEYGTYVELMNNAGNFVEMIATMKDTSSSISTNGNIASTSEEISTKQSLSSSNVEVNKKPIKLVENSEKPNQTNMKKGSLMTTEEREQGDVDRKVYLRWSVAAGGLSVGILMIIFFYFAEAITVVASWWLSYWSQHRNSGSPWFYLGIYIVINCCISLSMLGREIYCRLKSLRASKLLFEDLLNGVLYAPMSFFDTTPLGRIINRFSKDIYTVDESIPQTIRMYLGTIAKVTGVILYICVVTPLFLIGLVPMVALYYLAQRYYIKTSRELTRLESTSRSPIYALFSETLDGMSTIRAYGVEAARMARNNYLLDCNQASYFLNFSANCWLAVRLEFVGTCIITLAALFAVVARDDTIGSVADLDRQAFAGLAGLSISLALSVTQSLNWSVRMASDLESQMVSVERIQSYALMPQEKSHYLTTDPKSPWPENGSIEFRNVNLRYREGLPLVLQGMSIKIDGRKKVGICGRTGAGKSSIVTALLRLVELDGGSIIIDGVNISQIGLHSLRSVMAIIPQDPVLFSGTIRSNLDPFKKYTDAQLWDGLRRTSLTNAISTLDDVVNENGSNYSVGQRQLLCIARALLSQSKIIIMDEATAAVDVETDSMIQKTIRSQFADATCLTIAHRLNTILDSDMILVMDQGRVAEYDTPAVLLANNDTMFYKLVSNWEQTNN
eukprot:gene12636-16943_t